MITGHRRSFDIAKWPDRSVSFATLLTTLDDKARTLTFARHKGERGNPLLFLILLFNSSLVYGLLLDDNNRARRCTKLWERGYSLKSLPIKFCTGIVSDDKRVNRGLQIECWLYLISSFLFEFDCKQFLRPEKRKKMVYTLCVRLPVSMLLFCVSRSLYIRPCSIVASAYLHGCRCTRRRRSGVI